jgi:hypothetical protein
MPRHGDDRTYGVVVTQSWMLPLVPAAVARDDGTCVGLPVVRRRQ